MLNDCIIQTHYRQRKAACAYVQSFISRKEHSWSKLKVLSCSFTYTTTSTTSCPIQISQSTVPGCLCYKQVGLSEYTPRTQISIYCHLPQISKTLILCMFNIYKIRLNKQLILLLQKMQNTFFCTSGYLEDVKGMFVCVFK